MNRRGFLSLAGSFLLLSACASASVSDWGWENPHVPPNGGRVFGNMGYALTCGREKKAGRSYLPCDLSSFSTDPAVNIPVEVLREVDAEVRSILTYGRDNPVNGHGDDWKTPERSIRERVGDCEDFMALAAHLLLERGYPQASLYYLLLRTRGDRINHAALVCTTERGLMTCGDTMVRKVVQLNQAYEQREPAKWMCLASPRRWFKWKQPA